MKICFVTDAHQEIYVSQFKDKYENFLSVLGEDFMFYVSTDLPHLIEESKNLKVFDIRQLQQRHPESLRFENLDSRLSYRNYHWNLRRHIINQALQDGYEYVIWTDCDVKLRLPKDLFFEVIKTLKINNVYTQSTIWKFSETERLFSNYQKVFEDLKINLPKEKLITHDGPTAIYYLDDKKRKEFIKIWDDMTLYGYESKYWREGNWFISNLAYVFLLTNINIIQPSRLIFQVKHNTNDRYHK